MKMTFIYTETCKRLNRKNVRRQRTIEVPDEFDPVKFWWRSSEVVTAAARYFERRMTTNYSRDWYVHVTAIKVNGTTHYT